MAAVCLSVLLLIEIITLCVWHAVEGDSLDTRNNNLTTEDNQLETSNDGLSIQEHQLLTRYNSLTVDRDQLQSKCNNLTAERDQIQSRYNNLTAERDQLQAKYNNLTEQRDQLHARYNNLTAEKDQLKKERESILHKFNDLNWKYFNSSLYFISTEGKNWYESREDCKKKRADLVVRNSKEEQQFLSKMTKRVWIGLTDGDIEGTWMWVDNTAVTSTYWMPEEPNNVGNEDCGEILWYEDPLKTWNDMPCNNVQQYVCETVIQAF